MKVLFIAYYFPPDSSSGSLRPLYFANHLAGGGVGVHVLTAKVEDFLVSQTVDPGLVARLHRDVGVTRCAVRRPREALLSLRGRLRREKAGCAPPLARPALQVARAGLWQEVKDLVTDLLVTPDPQVGWIPDCLRRGREVAAREGSQAIWATGGPWSGLLCGVLLKKATGLPLVLDFRDPWVSNPGALRRGWLARQIDRFLERLVVRSADGVIANTAPLREDFLARYPELRSDRVLTISNGFEAYLPPLPRRSGKPLTIAHTGALYSTRNPVPLLKALKRLLDRGELCCSEVRLQLVGELEVCDPSLDQLLAAEPLRQVVEVVPRVKLEEAERYAGAADILLLIQPDFPLQVPRKLYDCMAARKPILCIAEPESATGRVVAAHELGVVCVNREQEIERALVQMVTAWRAGTLQGMGEERCDGFRNEALARRLQQFFTLIVADNGGHP